MNGMWATPHTCPDTWLSVIRRYLAVIAVGNLLWEFAHLAGIARTRTLNRATMRNIRQNLFLAFVYNALGVPIAASVFYPLFGWTLSPIIAAAAMALSSVSVVRNALRLRTAKL